MSPRIPVSRPRPLHPLVLLVASSVFALPLVSGSPAVAGEKPRDGCFTGQSATDSETPWCGLYSLVEAYGGGPCKPMVLYSAVAVKRENTIPPDQGCCGVGVDNAERIFGIRVRLRSGAAHPATAAVAVPWRAYVHCELTAGAGLVAVQFGGNGPVTTFNTTTPSFRDTLSGEAMLVATDGYAMQRVAMDGAVTMQWSAHAEVCNGDPPGHSDEAQIVIDPFVEIDPAWPDAPNWMVEKETAPGSGVWVEMQRDSATVRFTEITSGTLGESVYTAGLASGDYDADGDLDLFVVNQGNASCRLYRNDAGTLVDATTPELSLPATHDMDATWADVDGDGDLDLFMTRGLPTLKHVLMRNDGAAGFTRDTTSALCIPGYGRGIAWADYDRDGDLDVYLAQCGYGNRLFRNEGAGQYLDVTTPLLASGGCTMGGLWGDFDTDGDPDLFLVNRGQYFPCKLLRNDNGTFTDVTAGSGLPVNDLYTVFSGTIVDYDDDGRLDLYLSTDSQNRLFRNLGGGVFADSSDRWTGYTGLGSGVAWGDLDLDGDLDVYLTKRDQPNRIAVRYDRHFGNSMSHVGGPVDSPGSGNSAAWVDLDGDGDLDLYLGYNGANRLLRNDQALGNHWLQVDLHGTQSDRYGVGARIRVVSDGRSRHRTVTNQTGFWSGGNPLRQTFGLGAVAQVDTLEVRWPRGAVTTLAGPFTADRRVTVWEDGRVSGVTPGALAAGPARLLGSAPNPFAAAATIRFRLPEPAEVALRIHDVAGRRVRELRSVGMMPAGIGELAWDGRDENGTLVRAGVYFCRMRAGRAEAGPGMVFKLTRVE